MTEAILSYDRSLFLCLNSFHVAWLDKAMVFLSGQVLWLPLVALSFYSASKMGPKRNVWLFGLFLLLALIASDVTSSYIIKNIFNRLRPCREADLLPLIYQFGQKCGGRFGFVSSHSANSFALVIYTLIGLRPQNKLWHLIWLMPLIVSYSRIYLGVHYPGDILGGIGVGLFWGSFLAWALKNSREQV